MRQLTREVIRDLRKHLNMSQEQMAEIVGCHPCTISRIETGKSTPYRKNFERIFFVLGGFGIEYDVINEKSGYCQDQINKKVIEALEGWNFEEARRHLSELKNYIDINDKFDCQLLCSLELVLSRMEGESGTVLKDAFANTLMLTRSKEDFLGEGRMIYLTPVEMLILNNLALCYLDEGDTTKAIQILLLLIKMCDRVKDIPFVDKTRAVLYNNLGLSYLNCNQFLQAMTSVDKGIEYLRKKGGINLLFEILMLKARIFEMLGEHEESVTLKCRMKNSYSFLCHNEINYAFFEDFEPFSKGICIL